ncbi:MAG: UbiA family prenyltransferase, partial [Pseudomonadota bacterium]
IPLYLIFHAGNIITALPDYPSDRQGGKRTFPVRYGEPMARLTALLVLALAYITVVPTSPPLAPPSLAVIVIPAALLLALIVISGTLRKADAAAWSACKRFVNWTSASQAWLLGAWVVALLLEGRA